MAKDIVERLKTKYATRETERLEETDYPSIKGVYKLNDQENPGPYVTRETYTVSKILGNDDHKSMNQKE